MQPLLVRPPADGRYELIAGERRWRAAQAAGLEHVPAVLRDQEDAERLQTALVENMAREDLNPVDEARACATLVEDLGTQQGGAGAPRRPQPRRDLQPDPSARPARRRDRPAESGELSEGHGRAILQARGADVRRRLARDAVSGGWSVRETERRAKGATGKRGRRGARRDADRDAAFAEAEEALERAFGHDAKVRAARSGVKAELVFDDLDELRSFTRRLRRRR